MRARLTIHAAMGFGRSYGRESGFMGKKISGIFSSSIWDAYEQESSVSTIAFVTDIGNDLAYEEPVNRIMEWVQVCVERLTLGGARVAMTNVPIHALRGVSRAKFGLIRAVLFPGCRLTLSTVLNRAEELHEQLDRFARSRKMPIFSVPNAWYGFDPIHPRTQCMADYWRELFALLVTSESGNLPRRGALKNYLRLRTLCTPGLRRKGRTGSLLMSRAVLDDGSTITLH
jgi:hypothetical protein